MHKEVVPQGHSVFPRLHKSRWGQNLNPGMPAAKPLFGVTALQDIISIRNYLESNGGVRNQPEPAHTWRRKQGSLNPKLLCYNRAWTGSAKPVWFCYHSHDLSFPSPCSILHPSDVRVSCQPGWKSTAQTHRKIWTCYPPDAWIEMAGEREKLMPWTVGKLLSRRLMADARHMEPVVGPLSLSSVEIISGVSYTYCQNTHRGVKRMPCS